MTRKPSVSQFNQWRHMSTFTGYRLSIALLLGAFLMLPLPSPTESQLLTLAALQAAYGLLAMSVLALAPNQFSVAARANAVSLLMIIFIICVAVSLQASEAAWLLFIPVINAAFRLSGRGLLGVCVLAAGVWIGINAWPLDDNLWHSPRILAGLLPLTLVAFVVRALRDDNNIAHGRLTEMSSKDELTGTLNMRAFGRLLISHHSNAEYTNTNYALLMVDVEKLREINTKHGHDQGDQVLKAVAEALNRSIRTNDFVARYGGDEFIVFVDSGDQQIAQTISNRISQNVYNISLSFGGLAKRLEVTIGMAVYPISGHHLQDMMNFADSDMYKQKEFRRSTKNASPGVPGRQQADQDKHL